jgi:four helix bundle protein
MGSEIHSFRDLTVWQKAMTLVEQVYGISKHFPADERYGLTSQLRRASVSVPSNIAEGYGRHSTRDYIRFLQIALGSLNEMQTQLELGVRLGFVDLDSVNSAKGLCTEIEKMLVSLIAKLRSTVQG